MANSSTKGRKSAKQRNEELRRAELKRNITIFGIIGVLGIFLFLANFNIIGIVGDALSGFFFGLFGSLWYILPIVIIVLSFIVLFKPYPKTLIIGTVGLYFGIGFGIALIQSKSAEKVPFAEAFRLGFDSHKGGIFSLWPVSGIISLLGKPGTWILVILIILAAFVTLVGFGNIMDLSDRVNEWSESKEHQERLEYRRQKREQDALLAEERRNARSQAREEKLARMDNKAYGVEFPTLKEEKQINDLVLPKIDVTEIENITPVPEITPLNFTDNIQEVTVESLRARAQINTMGVASSENLFTPETIIEPSFEDDNDVLGIQRRTVNPINFGVENPNNSLITDGSRLVYESPEEKFAREQKEKREKERFENSLASNVMSYMEDDTNDIAQGNDLFVDNNTIEQIDTVPSVTRRVMPTSDPQIVDETDNIEPIGVTETVQMQPAEVYEEPVVSNIEPSVPAPAPAPVKKPKKAYQLPPINLLDEVKTSKKSSTGEDLEGTKTKLENTLRNFGVDARVTDVTMGPSVTRFEIEPAVGVKVSKIVNLSDDIKLNLAVADIRIEAPIPGKSAVGIEVPNKEASAVSFREMVESNDFKNNSSKIAFGAGRDIAGAPIISDIAKMPHVLIAGATGSGKSVCINTIIMSILYKAKPDDVKMIMIDPKVVELSVYNGIPHLLMPVVTDPKMASAVLQKAVVEMERRFKVFSDYKVRDLAGFNNSEERKQNNIPPMPQIVIIVDELADLMMVAGKDVETSICRIAQLARACGMHLIIATQRPSVNVITGLIKANMPSRIAFAVTSGIDSRTILDMTGAEKLLGKGDMLYFPQNLNKPIRAQGAFVNDNEVRRVVDFILKENDVYEADEEWTNIEVSDNQNNSSTGTAGNAGGGSDLDPLFIDAGRFIIEKKKASIGSLQRQFKVGFNRAARIMDQLCEYEVVGPEEGTKPRMILKTIEQFDEMVASGSFQ